MNSFHTPVFLKEVLEYLKPAKGTRYIDATVGGGGHSFEILRRGGIVLGIDADKDAIEYVKKNFKFQISNFKLKVAQGNFRDIDKIAHLNSFDKVNGIIFDLGVSSHQIDSGERGFSFQNDGLLDMRMDRELGVRALDLIKILTKGELYEIFTKFGEESRAWAISDRIVRSRAISPIETTMDLAKLVDQKSLPRVFQALRIAVNDELNSIQEALPKAIRLLEKNGRICVISFHSLEDRIVKKSFIEFERKGMGKIITKKPIIPSIEEINENRRSRSAKLRVFEGN